jgi:hypothetical protein
MSKLIFFEFQCETHGVFEDLVNPDERQAPCPHCARNAPRVISAPRINHLAMAMSASASPESIEKFDRMHREQKEKEQRQYDAHGDYPGMVNPVVAE